jgi:hypothetical protein
LQVQNSSPSARLLLARIARFPREHWQALNDFSSGYAGAADLIETSPPLAVCLANAATWDTLLASGLQVSNLIKQRRRKICEALGFPGTESVVRILAKIAPEACNIAALMRMRRRFQNPHLVKILSHITQIGEAELRLIAYWEPSTYVSVPLFLELAAKPKTESFRLLADTELMMERSDNIFPPLMSVIDVYRLHGRLVREQQEKEIATSPFPPPPIMGTATIQPILTPQELQEEGRQQNHCVSIYAEEVVDNLAYVYRVLEPERATVSIIRSDDDSWELGEFAGADNSQVSNESMLVVKDWLMERQFPPPPVQGIATIQPLSSPRELRDEGRRMNNPGMLDTWDVVKGWLYFYKVLEPERATVSIRQNEIWLIESIAGCANSRVSSATRSEVEKWLRKAQSINEEQGMLPMFTDVACWQ